MRKSYIWAVLIAGGLSAWMASPYVLNKNGESAVAEAAKPAEEAPRLFKVRVKTFTALSKPNTVSAQGLTEASARVEVRARTNGTILAAKFRQGQDVKEGATICELDSGDRAQQMTKAKAEFDSAQRDFNASDKLARSKLVSQSQLWQNKAKVDAAKAAIKSLELDKGYTDIKAPSDGVLVDKPAEAGSLLSVGGLCATLSKLDPLLVTANISERYVPYLSEGMPARAKLATGEEAGGKVRFISKIADVATRTFKVELEIPNTDGRMREGVTAELFADLPATAAHKIPSSILSLNDEGAFGVRQMMPDNTTKFTPVTVISQEADGMWVTGLPAEVTLVILGQDFIRDGEKVEPVTETAQAKP